MGLEAVSRGASQVVLVEQDRKIFTLLEENIESLDCGEVAVALQSDALSSIPLLRVPRPVDVVLIDPPYVMMTDDKARARVLAQLEHFPSILDPEGLVVLRTPLDPNRTDHSVPSLAGPEIHKMGPSMWVLFYGTKT